jgi:hypothetical protein
LVKPLEDCYFVNSKMMVQLAELSFDLGYEQRRSASYSLSLWGQGHLPHKKGTVGMRRARSNSMDAQS